MLPEIFEKIEQDFYLLGSTAIEDQLQDDVDKTLEIFIKAGIKVWMLTGDKMDTAKSIGFSCKLITHEFNLIELQEGSSESDIEDKLKTTLQSIGEDKTAKYGLIVGMDELTKIMDKNSLIDLVTI